MDLIHLLALACADRLGKEGGLSRTGPLVGGIMSRGAVDLLVDNVVIVAAESDVARLAEGASGVIVLVFNRATRTLATLAGLPSPRPLSL